MDLRANDGKGDDVKKHRLDVVRLSQLLAPEEIVDIPAKLKTDMVAYIEAVDAEGGVDTKALGIKADWSDIVALLRHVYDLTPSAAEPA